VLVVLVLMVLASFVITCQVLIVMEPPVLLTITVFQEHVIMVSVLLVTLKAQMHFVMVRLVHQTLHVLLELV